MCITFKIYFALREEKKTKLSEMKIWMVKTVRRFVVVFYCDFVLRLSFGRFPAFNSSL